MSGVCVAAALAPNADAGDNPLVGRLARGKLGGMCYSAQIQSDYDKFCRAFGAVMSLKAFARIQFERGNGAKVRIPRAVDRWFADPKTTEEQSIKEMIDAFDQAEASRLEAEMFAQMQRLNKATRAMEAKPTKKAAEDQRIAVNKIEAAKAKLANLRREDVLSSDRRFFPGWYVPVLIVVDDRPLVVPMRYGCRPAGKPSDYDRRYPGTYNARRDNLEGFWKPQFGQTHGLIVADVFYENVEAPDGGNRVLEFKPRDNSPLYIACLWSHWRDPKGVEPDLLSFAAITDEPEPEVAAAGHDRTIINIKPENIDSWLRPDGDIAAMQAIFDDKQHPFYEHRRAA